MGHVFGNLLIETDRDQLLEALVARIRGGLDYPTLLGAIAEASVRQPSPGSPARKRAS